MGTSNRLFGHIFLFLTQVGEIYEERDGVIRQKHLEMLAARQKNSRWIYEAMLRRYGLRSMADDKCHALYICAKFYAPKHPELALFLSIMNDGVPPGEFSFIVQVRRVLLAMLCRGEFVASLDEVRMPPHRVHEAASVIFDGGCPAAIRGVECRVADHGGRLTAFQFMQACLSELQAQMGRCDAKATGDIRITRDPENVSNRPHLTQSPRSTRTRPGSIPVVRQMTPVLESPLTQSRPGVGSAGSYVYHSPLVRRDVDPVEAARLAEDMEDTLRQRSPVTQCRVLLSGIILKEVETACEKALRRTSVLNRHIDAFAGMVDGDLTSFVVSQIKAEDAKTSRLGPPKPVPLTPTQPDPEDETVQVEVVQPGPDVTLRLAELEKVDGEVTQLRQEVAELEGRRQAQKDRIVEMEAMLAQSTVQAAALEGRAADVDRLQAEVQALQGTIETREKEARDAEERAAATTAELATVRAQLTAERARLTETSGEAAAARQAAEDLAGRLQARVDSMVQQHGTEVARLVGRAGAAEEALETERGRAERYRREKMALIEENGRLGEAAEKVEAAQQALVGAELNSVQDRLNAARAEAKEAAGRAVAAEEQVLEADKARSAMAAQLDAMKEEVAAQKVQLTEGQAREEALLARVDDGLTIISSLKTKLANVVPSARYDALRKQVEQSTERIGMAEQATRQALDSAATREQAWGEFKDASRKAVKTANRRIRDVMTLFQDAVTALEATQARDIAGPYAVRLMEEARVAAITTRLTVDQVGSVGLRWLRSDVPDGILFATLTATGDSKKVLKSSDAGRSMQYTAFNGLAPIKKGPAATALLAAGQFDVYVWARKDVSLGIKTDQLVVMETVDLRGLKPFVIPTDEQRQGRFLNNVVTIMVDGTELWAQPTWAALPEPPAHTVDVAALSAVARSEPESIKPTVMPPKDAPVSNSPSFQPDTARMSKLSTRRQDEPVTELVATPTVAERIRRAEERIKAKEEASKAEADQEMADCFA